MRLLIEKSTDFESVCIVEEVVTEGVGQQKNYFIQGPFLQSEVKNHNRRIYPREVMVNEVARYTKTKLNDNQAVGELGHPDTPTINLDRVSHKILELREDGNNWIGRAKILDTPLGKIVKNLMDEGVKFGVSSRGLGSLKEINGTNVVQSDYYIVTPADIVSDPSGPDCWATAVMEGKEWVLGSDGAFHEMIHETAKKAIDSAVDPINHRIDELKLLCVFEKILDTVLTRKS